MCGSKDEKYPSRILLCDCAGCPRCSTHPDGTPKCFRAYHLACLSPPLHRLPRGDWICPICAPNKTAWESGPPGPSSLIPLAPSDLPAPPLTFISPSPQTPNLSTRGRARAPPVRFGFFTDTTPVEPSPNPDYPSDPTTLDEALRSPQSEDWLKATNCEVASLFENGTFDIIDTPAGVRPIGSKWVFRRKYDAFGFLTKYKVRLVAKGFLQKPGLDYNEVFSPVSKLTTLRLLLAHAAANDLELKQLDVATAFLNGALDENVYVQIPPGLSDQYPNKCFHLRKAIYGLKQAPRVWWLNLSNTLTSNGFTPSYADTCLFHRKGKHGLVLMLVYVDDVLAVGHSDDVAEALKVITDTYKCSEPEDARSFLGMAINRNRRAGTLTLSQPTYVTDLAKKHNFAPDVRSNRSIPITPIKDNADAGPPLPLNNEYASLVGSLLYLANCTRPDLSFAVSTLARHLRAPCAKHMGIAKDLLRYALTTRTLGLTFRRPTSPFHSIQLVGYSDSDYANFNLPEPDELITRRSVTGFIFLANGTPVSWQSKKQVTVSRSSDEAEYQAMATAASQALWLRKLVAELDPPARKLTMWCDNTAALAHVHSPGSINKTKHVDIQYQFVLDRQTRGDLNFKYIHTSENLADIFTKALTKVPFENLRNKIFGSSS